MIVVGDSDDIALYRDLRRLGVAEYLFKPLSRDVVEQALRHACTGMTVDDQPGRLGKLISVVGARGGIGTTTIAVHLGAGLADSARGRTALIDLDLRGGTVALALALNLKPEPALRGFEAVLKRNDGDLRARANHGVALDMLGRHIEAQADYRRVLAAEPTNVAASVNLGLSLALTGVTGEAVAILEGLVRNGVDSPRVRQNLALAYGLKGDAEAAARTAHLDLDEAGHGLSAPL